MNIKFWFPLWAFGEADSVSCHGIPAANSSEFTVVVTTGLVLQNRGIIDKSLQLTAEIQI